MSPNKGQKIKDNSKDFMLRTRIDEECLKKLDFAAEKLGVTRSEIVRRGIDDEYNLACETKK